MRKKLILERKNRNLTQENIAKMLGISRTTYNAYELGTTNPPLDMAIKIKKLFKYDKDDIFLNENDNTIVKNEI